MVVASKGETLTSGAHCSYVRCSIEFTHNLDFVAIFVIL